MGQMLTTLQRLNKLSAARADFTERGMLNGTAYAQAHEELYGAHSDGEEMYGLGDEDESDDDESDDDDDEISPVDDPDAITSVELARTRGT